MHIIIPMSGVGQRFIDAGYKDPKPLIQIDGKPIIEHVINLFPGETKFTFICNSTHLATTNMRQVLTACCPQGNIVEIPNHKLGPVYAVLQIADTIDDEEEVIVNYCDFGTYWDYNDFLTHTRNRNADGAIPSYKGFHPHMLGTTNYAFMRDDKQWMLEIKEKEPFTNNRMEEYASNGTYYFKKGVYIKKYFKQLMDKTIHVNNEYYVSLVFNELVQDGLNVSIYEIQHMLQWGTPSDVEEYTRWSNYFKHIVSPITNYPAEKNSLTLIPLAGKGSRFANAGYSTPKPLIELSGKPMILQAAHCLPNSEQHTFICQQEHLDNYPLQQALQSSYPESHIIPLTAVTEGQACTCAIGLKDVDENISLHISASDNGVWYNKTNYQKLLEDSTVDAIVWTFRQHVSSKQNPEMYGWVNEDEGQATGVSVKKPISNDPYNDHAIVGTFYFRKVKYFNDAFNNLIANNTRVNNEFYVDSMLQELIDAGLNVKVFEVDDYICWGTPNDYETFVYWQSFFHKAKGHPYRLEKDTTVHETATNNLERKYMSFTQSNE